MGSKSALHWGVSVKVYFDLCVYNRPFDDQMQPRIMIESVGVVTIMALVGTKQIHSINSFVLDYENRKNPSLGRRSFIEKLLAESSEFIGPNDNIRKRALELEKKGIMGMDALHVASAEQAGADYFVSCDDVLINRLGRVEDLKVRASGLLEFISREVL